MQLLAITPSEVDFDIFQPGQELVLPVCIKNLDTRPRSFRIKAPTTRWFALRGIGNQHRLAPGLSVTFEVVFNGRLLDSLTGQEFHDTIRIAGESVSTVQEPPLELWVHARPPRPRLHVLGDLQFGVVAVGGRAKKSVQLVNKGSAAADYTITWDKALPVAVEPVLGRLGPAGSPRSSTTISVSLAPSEPGAAVGELSISTAGGEEPLICPLGASVVQTSYRLVDEATKAPVTEVNFGELFFGESASRRLTLVNNGPTEACFDLSFGSVADLKALLATGPDEEASTADDRLAAFLQVARIRAKSREDKGTMLKVSPISGVIAPYSSTQLSVTFKPFSMAGGRGFRAQPLSPQQQVQPFDGLLQVNLSSGKHLRLSVKGCGLACMLKVQPEVLHFGITPTYQWVDQLLQLSNNSSQLPMQLSVIASGAYFSSLPGQLELAPGGNREVVIRYRPKALGHHQAAMCVQVVSQCNPGQVLFEAAVQVMGSSLSLGPKQPLPGGIDATPETFTLPRALVNEADAAVARLVAEKTYKRPHIWEVPENADRLEGIGATDKFGVTQEVHQARVAHSDQYTAFVRAKRTAAAHKYLTQKEGGEDDINMGMQPYRGLHPPPLRLRQQAEPLWTVSQHVQPAPVAQKLPPAAVLSSIPTYKEWPETAQERTACSAPLTAEQLSSLTVAPRQLDFGKLSPASPGQQHFLVTNPLDTLIHVVLNVSAIEGLSCSGPCSQVVPVGGTAKFVVQLHCHDTLRLKEQIQYVVNACHFQDLLVTADVVPVTLDVSDEELMFTFSLDNWDDHVEQALMLDNPHNFPVDYEWSLSSQVFSATPVSGTIRPKSSCQVSVKWTPGSSACKAAQKQAAIQSEAAAEKPQAAAAVAAAAAGTGSQVQKLSKTGSSSAGKSGAAAKAAAAATADGSQSPSKRTAAAGSGLAAAAASGKAAAAVADNKGPSGAGSTASIPTNTSSITVELPAGMAPLAPAAASAVGCQHTGYMTLKLKGGGDVPPKKVMLYGELPASLLKFAAKEIYLGPVPLFEQQTALVQIKNTGSTDAAYRVLPNSLLTVTPERGQVAAEGSAELELALMLTQPGPLSTVLELDLRGGKTLKLPVRAEGVVPQVHVAEPFLQFPSMFIGTTHTLPLTLVNTTPVTATLMCDFMQLPEFELHLSRDAWANAGYAACPVKRIGANGEMSAVGSIRGSRRSTIHGTRGGGGGGNSSGCGYKFLITLNPSGSLPLQLVYRPSLPQQQRFALPLALQHSYSSSTQADAQPAESGPTVQASGAAGAAHRRATTERRTSATGSAHSKPGSAVGSSRNTAGGAAAAHALEPPKLAVPVEAEGVVPKVILNKSALDFGSKVARRALQGGKSPHAFDVLMRNNTDSTLQIAVGPPAGLDAFHKPSNSMGTSRTDASKQQAANKGDVPASSAYVVEGWDTRPSAPFVSLGPEEALGFSVRFSPTEARVYEAVVPVYLDANRAAPYMFVQLTGTGTLPRLTFDMAECVLPLVPLGIASTRRIYVVNDGYDNLELSVRLPPDSSRLPVTVSFPEGKLIGLAKERLPLDVRCCSSKPLSFTTFVDLLDEDGRAFSLMVSGAADNCSLSHGVFTQLNGDRLQLAPPADGVYPLPLRLTDGIFEMPLDEAVGPLHLTQGVCKYLSSMTSSNWTKKARASSKAGAPADDSSSAAVEANLAAVLRQWLLSSRGKGLLELIEAMGGKPVSLKGAAAGKASGGGKVTPVQQLLAIYEAALTHLQAQGALLNSVKPEYLLPEADFTRLMEDRTAAAAGNPEEEERLDYWAAVEASFGAYSAMAWNCVLLQLLKVYALARVNPAALRQLLSSMDINTASSMPQPAAAVQPAAASPAAAKAASRSSRSSVASAGSAAGAKGAAAAQAPAAASASTADVAAAAAPEPGCVPPDEVLSGSNIYSTAEACLLAWMNAHAVKAFPKLDLCVTNFGRDLRDGVVLGALIAAYWTGDSAGQLLSRLHPRPATARHLKENQEMVVKALQELCLPYELCAADLDEAEPLGMLLLVTYLFTALPQLLPRATLDFSCKLGDQQMREIQLSNPTRRPLAYAARLEGASDFSLEASLVKIDPGQSTQVPVKFSPSTSLPKACRLVLMSRRDNSAASAATLVFLLKGQADVRVPLKQVHVSAPLYQLSTQEFSITNPFPADCDISISIVPVQEPKPMRDADKAKKDGKPAGNTSAKAAPASAQAQVRDVSKFLPEAFGLDRHRLRLKAGASEKLKLSFLPFVMPAATTPASPPKGRKAGRAQAAAEPQAPAPMRSMLVLKDSDCGEFTYELFGEVGQPATFMQHETKVGLDGVQAIELQLPFSNHLLENARRSYTEKHPLGRDKEQLSRLRADIGSTNDRGERVLEYTVTCDSPFFTAPPVVTLKASAPQQSAQDATAASSPAVTRLNSPAQGTRNAGAMQQQQQQGQGMGNVLKLGLKPVGPGVYPAKLVLTSALDVRHIELQVTAQARGQAAVLELECPARQQVLQELPLLNAGSDVPLSAAATLSGKGFSGPKELTVQAKVDGCYPLTFTPPGSGNFSGTLELLLNPTGEKLQYTLNGKASEPLAEGHVLVECQARSPTLKRLQVPNIIGSLPLQYSVYADADWLSGPASLSCASANRGDTYKLSVCPLVSGTHWGSLTFMAPDGNYCWFSVEVRATEPPEEGSINASCPVHQALAIKVSLTNPTDKPLHLRAVYGCCSLLGPATFVAPAGPGTEATFECYYAPLMQGHEEGVLRLVSRECGEFWWKLALDATPALPQPPIQLSAPLGSAVTHMLCVANPTAAEAIFTSSSSSPDRFWLEPGTLRVAPNSVADVQLCYKPGSYLTREEGTVCISSQTAGSYEYICAGQGEAPTGSQTSSISSVLGTASNSCGMSFTNPFNRPVEVEVSLSSVEAAGTFKLLLPGAAAPPGADAEEKDVAWTGLHADHADADGGGLLADAASMLGQLAAAVAAEDQAKQPKQPTVQQVARLTVAAGATLELPVRFAPKVLRQAIAQLAVAVLPETKPAAAEAEPAREPERRLISWGKDGPKSAAAAAVAAVPTPPNPLTWRYNVTGVARADAPGVKFAVKCIAKQNAELVLEVPLPGLDVEQAAAAAAAAAAEGASPPTPGISGALGGFKFSLLLPEEHRAALAAAVTLEPLDSVPAPSPSASLRSNSCSSAAAAVPVGDASSSAVAAPSVLRYLLRFAPQKALNAVAQLQVECGEGGACWMYDVNLSAAAPDIAGVLNLEAHLNTTAELPLFLTASGPEPQPFTAEFTPESPLNFDVVPSRGVLPPAPDHGPGEGPGSVTEGVGQAPLKVTFVCKELGKVVTGKLVVITPDRQETFLVKGKQPAYLPPQTSALPSGMYLTGTTASSRAKGSSQKSLQVGVATAKSDTQAAAAAAATGSSAGGAQQQQRTKVNYLQQNIRAAAANSSPKKADTKAFRR